MRRRIALALFALALSACTAPTASAPPTVEIGLRPVTAAPSRPYTPSATVRLTPTHPPIPTSRTVTLPPYRASAGAFVRVVGDGLLLDGERFTVRGLTLARDLWAADALPTLEADFARLQRIGANTVRLPLRGEALFADGAPVPDAFARLDAVLRLADAYDLRVILLLNAEAPPAASLTTAQVAVLAARYRREPVVLMWELCHMPTQNYANVPREDVLAWLAETAAAVRMADAAHPLTATLRGDALGTLSMVDVVGVAFGGSVDDLRREVATLRQFSAKPVWLSELSGRDMAILHAAVRAVEGDRLAGWLLSATNTPADPFQTLDALLNP